MKALPCTCKNAFQDERYGNGIRIHNPMAKGGWRCTACAKEKSGDEPVRRILKPLPETAKAATEKK